MDAVNLGRKPTKRKLPKPSASTGASHTSNRKRFPYHRAHCQHHKTSRGSSKATHHSQNATHPRHPRDPKDVKTLHRKAQQTMKRDEAGDHNSEIITRRRLSRPIGIYCQGKKSHDVVRQLPNEEMKARAKEDLIKILDLVEPEVSKRGNIRCLYAKYENSASSSAAAAAAAVDSFVDDSMHLVNDSSEQEATSSHDSTPSLDAASASFPPSVDKKGNESAGVNSESQHLKMPSPVKEKQTVPSKETLQKEKLIVDVIQRIHKSLDAKCTQLYPQKTIKDKLHEEFRRLSLQRKQSEESEEEEKEQDDEMEVLVTPKRATQKESKSRVAKQVKIDPDAGKAKPASSKKKNHSSTTSIADSFKLRPSFKFSPQIVNVDFNLNPSHYTNSKSNSSDHTGSTTSPSIVMEVEQQIINKPFLKTDGRRMLNMDGFMPEVNHCQSISNTDGDQWDKICQHENNLPDTVHLSDYDSPVLPASPPLLTLTSSSSSSTMSFFDNLNSSNCMKFAEESGLEGASAASHSRHHPWDENIDDAAIRMQQKPASSASLQLPPDLSPDPPWKYPRLRLY